MDKSEDYLALVINKISEWANIKTETDKQDLTNNIFKILGVEDFEIRHSNFLAWLFNKNENPIQYSIHSCTYAVSAFCMLISDTVF